MRTIPPAALLAEAKALASKATPGPWHVEPNTTLIWGESAADYLGYPVARAHARLGHGEGRANAAFIARSRTLIPALCAALRQALKAIKDLEARLDVAEVQASEAEAALWRIAPNTHTIGTPDPFEGLGETYADAYRRVAAELAVLRPQMGAE